MSCNCKVNSDILKIHKNYGVKNNISWKEKFSFNTVEGFKYIILILLVIIFIPLIIVIYFVYVFNNKQHININKLLKIILRK